MAHRDRQSGLVRQLGQLRTGVLAGCHSRPPFLYPGSTPTSSFFFVSTLTTGWPQEPPTGVMDMTELGVAVAVLLTFPGLGVRLKAVAPARNRTGTVWSETACPAAVNVSANVRVDFARSYSDKEGPIPYPALGHLLHGGGCQSGGVGQHANGKAGWVELVEMEQRAYPVLVFGVDPFVRTAVAA